MFSQWERCHKTSKKISTPDAFWDIWCFGFNWALFSSNFPYASISKIGERELPRVLNIWICNTEIFHDKRWHMSKWNSWVLNVKKTWFPLYFCPWLQQFHHVTFFALHSQQQTFFLKYITILTCSRELTQTVSPRKWRWVSQRSSVEQGTVVPPLFSAIGKKSHFFWLHFQSAPQTFFRGDQRPTEMLQEEKANRSANETRWLNGICKLTAGGGQLLINSAFASHTHHLQSVRKCSRVSNMTRWMCRTTTSLFSQQRHHNKNRRTKSWPLSLDQRGVSNDGRPMALKICSLDSLSINLFYGLTFMFSVCREHNCSQINSNSCLTFCWYGRGPRSSSNILSHSISHFPATVFFFFE